MSTTTSTTIDSSEVAGSGPRPAAAVEERDEEDVHNKEKKVEAGPQVLVTASATTSRPAQAEITAAAKNKVELQFPEDVPEAVRTSIIEFQVPADYVLCPIPASTERSILYYWGVRMERKDAVVGQRGHRKQLWACLTSDKCRQKRRLLAISSGQTTNATQHLLTHKQQSSRSKKAMDNT